MNRKIIAQAVALVTTAFLVSTVAVAQTNEAATESSDAIAESSQIDQTQRTQAIRRLLTIKEALEDKREQIRNLIEQREAADETDKAKINEKIAALRETVDSLTKSFENIAVSGANLSNLADAVDQKLAWRDELMRIARPILNSLKGATEKPRRIEELRRAIELQEQQLEVSRKATESIALFGQYEMPPVVAAGLDEVAASWHERNMDTRRSLEITRHELRNLEAEEFDVFETIVGIVREFILGRGLTLLIALFTGVALWYVMYALRRLIKAWRRPAQDMDHAARIRLVLYGYHLMTIVLVSLAVLSVFYVRGDLLLLSLSIIILVMLALGVWRHLPGYIEEARLLINIGAARAGERVNYKGIPLRITSLNLYSELRNPELEGTIRLPLSALAQLISRPQVDEAWFPCQVGDYVLLPDGVHAHVLQQTVELVRLKVRSSIVQYSTEDFLQLNVRNLSCEGFGVVVIFGIDYQHQEISLDQVPERFRSGLNAAFEHTEFGNDLKNLVVDFEEAGTNSLNYLIYAVMDGQSAASYHNIKRLIQQTCVDICNQEGWVIPFAQLTIHQAEA